MGGGGQDLSDCVAYSFNVPAPPVQHPIAAQLLSGFPLDLGQVIRRRPSRMISAS